MRCLSMCILLLQDIEANLLKQDKAKAQLKQQHDQPAAVAKALELNDAAATKKRGRMMLPAPQVCRVLLALVDALHAEKLQSDPLISVTPCF